MFPFDCLQVALWALTFKGTKDSKNLFLESRSETSEVGDTRSCHNIFRGSQIWDSYHVKFTFVLASWTQRGDCWTFHTQPFTHTVLCSVKLPSDVALSEQSPWGPDHLRKQKRPGGDICSLLWILMTARSAPRCCTQLHSPAHTTIWSENSSNQCLQRRGAICTTGHFRVKMLKKCVVKSYLVMHGPIINRVVFWAFLGGSTSNLRLIV